jgi:branched-chain amino acid transport system substrate-binding protein
MQVLRQCGDDLSRENILRQATNLHDFVVPVALPGILVNSSPTNYHPMRAMQLEKWNGRTWSLFGSVIQGSQS